MWKIESGFEEKNGGVCFYVYHVEGYKEVFQDWNIDQYTVYIQNQ